MPRQAAQPKLENHPVMQGDPDALTAEEEAAAQAEETGAITPSGDQAAEPQQQQQAAETPAVAEGAEQPPAQEGKPESVAQQRIRALVEERNRVSQENAQLKEDWTRLDERRKTFQQLQDDATKQAEAAKVQATRPDPDVDPSGARAWDAEQRAISAENRAKAVEQQFQQFLPQYQQNAEVQQIRQWVQGDIARVKVAHPDYDAAYNHLRQTRIGLNMRLGYNEQQATALWDVEEAAYTRQAATNRVSIAEFAYDMAKVTGYQPPQANGAQQPNGATQQQANGAPNARERVQQIQQAQRMQGLGGKQSAAEEAPGSNVKNMNAAQFNQYLDSFGADDNWMSLKKTDPALFKVIEAKFQELG